jgi:SNF2 family DNA or RNA helicase
MAKAICSVPAAARWAVTGTPIQNRLGDLAALFKFLDVYPYGDIRRFDADITHLWKSGESKEAVERLKRLSRCLILRRPKTTINLPTRKDVRCPVNFTSDERMLYEHVKHQAIAQLAEASSNRGRGETSQSITFVNVIQQINALRMICNLGLHYGSRHDIKTSEYQINSSQARDWTSIAQQTFNFQCEIASITCQRCKSSLDITERLFNGSGNQFVESPLFSQCLMFICSDCLQRLHVDPLSCGHEPPHPFAPVSLNPSILEESITAAHPAVGSNITATGLPSKVISLVRQLKAQPPDVKRSVKKKSLLPYI